MEEMKRINYINDYLKEKFGERTLKIGIDGGFTCPNRDGTKAVGGCAFCSERGSGDHLKESSIPEQLTNYFHSYKAQRADSFILYFQNFSNTYDTIDRLKQKYDLAIQTSQAIIHEQNLSKKIVGLAIATRPDCITEEICQLLHSYLPSLSVSVELGLQTANDTTKEALNLQYTNEDFLKAVLLLRKYAIDIVVHMMVGLPNETHQDIMQTVAFINKEPIQGIKIHSTYIVQNTLLEKMYLTNHYTPLTKEEYLEEVTHIITHLNPQIVIHRISGDAPKNLLVAPSWNLHKKYILNGVFNRLKNDHLWQGMYYQNS